MKINKINTNINLYKVKTMREAKYIERIALNELESDALAIESAKEDVKVARKNLTKAKAALKKQKQERSELRKFIKRLEVRIKALPDEMATNRDIKAVLAEAYKEGMTRHVA